MQPQPRYAVVSPRSIALFVAFALAGVLLVLFLYAARRVLIWMLIALVLALALNYVVEQLERWLPRAAAAVAAFLGAIVLVGSVGYVLVPVVVDQVTALVERIPEEFDRLEEGRGPLGAFERRFGIADRIRTFVEEQGVSGAFGLHEPLVSAALGVVTTLIATFSIAFLVLFMLTQGPRWRQGILDALPDRQRPLWERVSSGVSSAVGGWVIGAVIVAIPATVGSLIVLLLLGVDYPFALALVVALLNPIPFIGAPTAAVVVGTIALVTAGLFEALVFVGFLVAYQQLVENHLLVPLVYGKTVRISSLGVLIAVLVGGELAGIVGALLAIPVAGALATVVTEVREWRRAERQPSASGP